MVFWSCKQKFVISKIIEEEIGYSAANFLSYFIKFYIDLFI